MSVVTDRERLDLKNNHPCAHIVEWDEGDPIPDVAVCGAKLKGIPADNDMETCVVCLDLTNGGEGVEPW